MSKFALVLMVAFMTLAAPTDTEAQAPRGCPWCTTPTTCGLVGEDTWVSECKVTQENGCEPTVGLCFVQQTLLEEMEITPADLIRGNHPALGDLALVPVGENLFARWDCAGELQVIAEQSETGEIVFLNTPEHSSEYSFDAVYARFVGTI